MKQLFLAAFGCFLLVACGKDSFQTTPQLELVSVSTNKVPINGTLGIVIKFTDKQGDISDTLVMVKNRINQRAVTETLRDTVVLFVPTFPKEQQGQLELSLEYQNYLISAEVPPRIPGSNPPENEPDTLNMRFVLYDKAGNKSDSLPLNNIIIQR